MEEYWDVYDRFRRKNGKVIKRDSDQWLQDGEYHIVVTGIIENANNQILISRRKDDKKLYPGLWKCTGGSVQIEESSIQAIIREVYEEIGIELSQREGCLLGTVQRDNYFRDVWKFKKNIKFSDIKFNDGELVDVKWVTIKEYEKLYKKGAIVSSGDCVIESLKEKELKDER